MKQQAAAVREGVHVISATPGRLKDILNKVRIVSSIIKKSQKSFSFLSTNNIFSSFISEII